MNSLIDRLNKALRPSQGGGNPGRFTHENEVAILDAAKQLLNKSEAGRELLLFARDKNIQLHVLKNKSDFGVLPKDNTVYISCPAGQELPTVRAVIHLAGALREAMQEHTADLKRPNISIEPRVYAHLSGERRVDQLYWMTAVVYEIYEATGLLEIVDEFVSMGYLNLYEAYKTDLNGSSSSQ
jgi:hypothetical protein